MSIREYPEQDKQRAHDRAEQIRLGLQSTAVLYARAVAEEDWRVLGYQNVAGWSEAEFGMDRFSRERRQEIVSLLTEAGWTQRRIAAAVRAGQDTVKRDQQRACELGRSQDPTGLDTEPPLNARQRAAREREEARQWAQEEAEARLNEPQPFVQQAAQGAAELIAAQPPAVEQRRAPVSYAEPVNLAGTGRVREVQPEYAPETRQLEWDRVQANIARTWITGGDALPVREVVIASLAEDGCEVPGFPGSGVLPDAVFDEVAADREAPVRAIPLRELLEVAPRQAGRPAGHYVPAALDAMARGLTQGQFARQEGMPDNSMVIAKAWGIAGERRRAELQAVADAEAALESELQERTRQRHVLAQWADQLDKTVAGYRDAPAIVLDELARRLADLRRTL